MNEAGEEGGVREESQQLCACGCIRYLHLTHHVNMINITVLEKTRPKLGFSCPHMPLTG